MAVDLRALPLGYRQLDYIVNSDRFVNLADGAVRSGKSVACLIRWLMFIADEAPSGGDLVVCSRTFDTAMRNVFGPLMDASVFGDLAKATQYTRGAPTATILGRTVQVITFNDARAEARLRGMTAAGTYVDEWSLMQKGFHDQLLARHSLSGGQIFGNTNPDNPSHFLMQDGIKEAGPGGRLSADWRVIHFVLDDNPGLTQEVKDRYHRQYTGLWFKRNILGLWVVAEGAVFDMWDDTKHVITQLPDLVRSVALGVDVGSTNPTAGMLLSVSAAGQLILSHEWRHDNKRSARSMTDAEVAPALIAWLDDGPGRPDIVAVDPAAANFKRTMFRLGLLPMNADNDVLSGIRLLGALLSEGLLVVHESCRGWI